MEMSRQRTPDLFDWLPRSGRRDDGRAWVLCVSLVAGLFWITALYGHVIDTTSEQGPFARADLLRGAGFLLVATLLVAAGTLLVRAPDDGDGGPRADSARLRIAVATAGIFLFSALLSATFIFLEHANEVARERHEISSLVEDRADALERLLRDGRHASEVIAALVDPDRGHGRDDRVEALAAELLVRFPAVERLELAPLQGGTPTPGATFRPLDGDGLVARYPVLLPGADGVAGLWGFVVLHYRLEVLADVAGLGQLEKFALAWRLDRDPDAGAAPGDGLDRPLELLVREPIVVDNLRWELVAGRPDGLPAPRDFAIDAILALTIIVSLTQIGFGTVRQPLRVAQQVAQRTQALRAINRRLEQVVAERAQVETALRKERLLLAQTQRLGATGSWWQDLGDGRFSSTRELRRIFGWDEDAEEGSFDLFAGRVAPEDAARVAAMRRGLGDGTPYDIEYRIRVGSEERWVREIAEARIDSTPTGPHLIGAVHDITRQKRDRAELDAVRKHLELAISGAELGLWDLDVTSGRVTYSAGWASMLGYRLEEIPARIDAWERLVHPDDLPRVRALFDAHLEGHTEVYQADHRMQSCLGDWRWIHTRGKVVQRDAQGRPARVAGTHLDVTDRKRAEEALRAKQQFLDLILASSGEGIFGVDRDGRFSFCNQTAATLLGYADGTGLIGSEAATILCDPEPGDGTDATVAPWVTVDRTPAGGPALVLFRRDDGSRFFAECRASPMREGERRVGVVINFTDATLRRARDLRLKQMSLAVEQSPVAILITSVDAHIEYVNPQFCRASGYSAAELVGRTPRMLRSDETPQEVYRDLWATILRGEVWSGELCNRRKDGSLFWESVSIAPIKSDQGEILNFVGVKEDITVRRQMLEKMWHQANFDPLTGLANREHFAHRVELAIARAKRSGRPFVVLFVDMDRFKPVNDALGHEAGDAVLREVAARMSDVVRDSDLVGRIGGDEFVILGEEIADAATAYQLAEKVHQALTERVYAIAGAEFRLGSSIGIALFPEDGAGFQQLLSVADGAMYRVKQGRAGGGVGRLGDGPGGG